MKNTNLLFTFWGLVLLLIINACTQDDTRPTVAFMDAFKDDTIEQARIGFFKALSDNGYDENEGTLSILYRNAQGDLPTLIQSIKYAISKEVDLIATCPSLSTITAVQQKTNIPVVMMVSPTPEKMQLVDKNGNAPENLFGVAETISYIDTSFALIQKLVPKEENPLKIGLLYNQAETQSVNAYNRLKALSEAMGVILIAKPVNSSAELKLVTAALLKEEIDVFFANPDNVVFAGFETIFADCTAAGVPVFTSEAGLVARGAVAAYGPDLYAWGYQAGVIATKILNGSTIDPQWELVQTRISVYNPQMAEKWGLKIPDSFSSIE